MDKIIIEGASFLAHIGITADERVRKQELFLDLHAFIDLRGIAGRDEISATVSYVDIHDVAGAAITARPYQLVETIAEDVAAAVLRRFQPVMGVMVRIHKPGALRQRGVRSTAVEILRMRND
jgi:dihydroneopterin aldolase